MDGFAEGGATWMQLWDREDWVWSMLLTPTVDFVVTTIEFGVAP